MTRCKYCRIELKPGMPQFLNQETGEGHCYYVHECRERMRDRERRIVRVYWYTRDGDGTVEYYDRLRYALACARDIKAACYRVTVRRKVKS